MRPLKKRNFRATVILCGASKAAKSIAVNAAHGARAQIGVLVHARVTADCVASRGKDAARSGDGTGISCSSGELMTSFGKQRW